MSYRVLLSPEMKKFVEQLDSKSYRIIINGLKKLGENRSTKITHLGHLLDWY